jgi:hypothetical protein
MAIDGGRKEGGGGTGPLLHMHTCTSWSNTREHAPVDMAADWYGAMLFSLTAASRGLRVAPPPKPDREGGSECCCLICRKRMMDDEDGGACGITSVMSAMCIVRVTSDMRT